MKQERIQNPSSVERDVIESKIAEGCHVILQFDGPRYTPDLLKKINNLCGELGKDLEVRFCGHKFDASHLRFLPDVAALSFDCLLEATNLSALNNMANLRRLSLGIYRLDDQHILKALQLQNLERLAISETAKANIANARNKIFEASRESQRDSNPSAQGCPERFRGYPGKPSP